MNRPAAVVIAAVAALCLVPGAALAAPENVSMNGGELVYTGDTVVPERDTVYVDPTKTADWTGITETTSPAGSSAVSSPCIIKVPYALCPSVTALRLSPQGGDDMVTVRVALPARVDGGEGADVLSGAGAADVLSGGAGADRLDAAGGNDVLLARDGVRDEVTCGDGEDRAEVDALDVHSGCESVLVGEATMPPSDDETSPGAPPVTTPGSDSPTGGRAPLPLATVAEAVAVSSEGVAPLVVTCAQADGCRGTVYLDPAPRRRRAQAARRGRFGRSVFTAAAGERTRVGVRLSSAARRRLGLRPRPGRGGARTARRGRVVRAQVTIVVVGRRPKRQMVALRRPRR